MVLGLEIVLPTCRASLWSEINLYQHKSPFYHLKYFFFLLFYLLQLRLDVLGILVEISVVHKYFFSNSCVPGPMLDLGS